MNKLLSLTKLQVKDFMSKYSQQLNMNKALSRLLILLPIFLYIPVFQIVKSFYDSFSAIGMPELTLTYIHVAVSIIVFITGIPLIISLFFYSKDLSLLATLPIKEDTIVFSKLATVYVYLFGISALLFGTGVGFYGIAGGFKPIELLLGIIALFLTPILPMIFATLIIIPFMTMIGGRKNRNMMILVGNLIFIVIILGLQVLVTRLQLDPENMQRLLASKDGVMSIVGSKFPPSVWMTKMVMKSWLEGLYYIGLNLGFVVLLKFAATSLYKGAMSKYNQQASATKKGNLKDYNYKATSKRILLIKRHIGIIFHNPTFLLNTVMNMFVPILLFVIYTFMGIMDMDTFKDPMLAPFMIYIYTGIVGAPILMGSLSTTAITREGKTFWETRVWPISAKENLQTRILTTIILSLSSSLILGIIAGILLPVTFVDIILTIICVVIATLCFSTLDLIINITRPYLNWSNPTAAVKNNLNVMLSLLPRMGFGIVGFALFRLLPDVGGNFMIAIFSVIFSIGFVVSYGFVFGRLITKFSNMDIE